MFTATQQLSPQTAYVLIPTALASSHPVRSPFNMFEDPAPHVHCAGHLLQAVGHRCSSPNPWHAPTTRKMASQPTASMVLATFSRLLDLSAESRLFTMPAMLLLITCRKQSGVGQGRVGGASGGWAGRATERLFKSTCPAPVSTRLQAAAVWLARGQHCHYAVQLSKHVRLPPSRTCILACWSRRETTASSRLPRRR